MNMEQFYKNVINDLGKRLYDNLANKEQELDAERIDAMKNVYILSNSRKSEKKWKIPLNSSTLPPQSDIPASIEKIY